MGLFSGFKKALNIGGVHVAVSAPSSAKIGGEAIPVTVTVTTKSPQTVKGLKVELLRIQRNASADATTNTVPQAIYKSEDNTSFQIQPGETKTVQLNIDQSAGAALQDMMPGGEATAQIAGMLQGVEKAASLLSHTEYDYRITATAYVDGAKLQPSGSVGISLNRLGEIGGTLSL